MSDNQRRIIEGQEELVNIKKRLELNKLSESIKDNDLRWLEEKMKTEQEICKIINEYEKDNPCICGTDSLIKFIQWYDKKESVEALQRMLGHLEHELTEDDVLVIRCKELIKDYKLLKKQ